MTYLSPLTLLPPLLLSIRHTLFPHASLPSPAPPTPSPSEQVAIKTACAHSIALLVPHSILTRFFGTVDLVEIHTEIEHELDLWSDSYLNRHLAYSVLELIMVRIMPELGEKGVSALIETRLGDIERV